MIELTLEIINNSKDIHWRHKKRKISSVGKHFQTYYELIFILDGEAKNQINNRTFILSKNDIILIKKDVVHEITTNNPDTILKYINIAFSEKIMTKIKSIFPNFIFSEPYIICNLQTSKLQRLINLYNYINLNVPIEESQIEIELLLYHVIKEFVYNNPNEIKKQPEWIKKIILSSYNPSTEHIITLKELFNLSPYSKQYTIKKFYEYLNTTPTDFINEIRIQKATDLLINTDDSITSICYIVGFNSVEYFDRIFKTKTNMTPHQFRKSYHTLLNDAE